MLRADIVLSVLIKAFILVLKSVVVQIKELRIRIAKLLFDSYLGLDFIILNYVIGLIYPFGSYYALSITR